MVNVLAHTMPMTTHTPARRTSTRGQRSAGPSCGVEALAAPQYDTAHTVALADRLKALADPTRLRMLELLVEQTAPLCVCDLTRQFEQHQPTISHHLRILRAAGLVESEKRGVWSYYWATEAGKRSMSALQALA